MRNLSQFVETKAWGTVQHTFSGPVSTSLLNVEAGGFSSVHTHEKRWNRIHVISGKLNIRFHSEDGSVLACTMLSPGQHLDIEPKVVHSFQVYETGQAVETYWTIDGSAADFDDIQRKHPGGWL